MHTNVIFFRLWIFSPLCCIWPVPNYEIDYDRHFLTGECHSLTLDCATRPRRYTNTARTPRQSPTKTRWHTRRQGSYFPTPWLERDGPFHCCLGPARRRPLLKLNWWRLRALSGATNEWIQWNYADDFIDFIAFYLQFNTKSWKAALMWTAVLSPSKWWGGLLTVFLLCLLCIR